MGRLTKANPANAWWQNAFSTSYITVGDAQAAQGDLAAALKSYQASLAVMERLANSVLTLGREHEELVSAWKARFSGKEPV